MAKIITTLANYITYLNTLYQHSSTEPTAGDEDYTDWTNIANIAINVWENATDFWRELIVDLADAADGTKTTSAATYNYALPTLFKFPLSSYVWLGSNTNKTPFKVIQPQDIQLYENNSENWCYFLNGYLKFNPNLTMTASQTIHYIYYKTADKISSATDTFEMSDPMFAVYFALAELKKEEGDPTADKIATQKLNAMIDSNDAAGWFNDNSLIDKTGVGFGESSTPIYTFT